MPGGASPSVGKNESTALDLPVLNFYINKMTAAELKSSKLKDRAGKFYSDITATSNGTVCLVERPVAK